MAAAVELRNITKRFPGVVANDGVDFEAAEGEVHALLGENGAGKSTLSNILTGLYHPDDGQILLYGEQKVFGSPRDALEAGIGMVHQHFRLVPPFTVAENVILGDQRGEGRRFLVNPRHIERRVAELGERYRIVVEPRARVWQLSLGEQQRVEILKALYREARILILDEPTAVLTPQEAESLFVTLRVMAEEGRTVIFISHKLNEVAAVSDRVTVLRAGKTVAMLATRDTTSRSLASLMVGREVAEVKRVSREEWLGDTVLEVSSVSALGDRGSPALREVSLTLRSGEILGVAGVAGNGQRELAEVVTGMRTATQGSVTIDDKRLRPGDARAAIRAQISHVPEDRLHTGVAPSLSIASNSVLKTYRGSRFAWGPLLRLRTIRQHAAQLIRHYDVRGGSPELPARRLSGGNLQKIVLAREFEGQPRVLVVASPTRGLDVSAIETVHAHLRTAASGGVGVLLISEDLDEILALADRIAVMYEGEIVAELEGGAATVEEIGLLMAGGEPE
jgi:general nucleoside transport system ATP-binding protein